MGSVRGYELTLVLIVCDRGFRVRGREVTGSGPGFGGSVDRVDWGAICGGQE